MHVFVHTNPYALCVTEENALLHEAQEREAQEEKIPCASRFFFLRLEEWLVAQLFLCCCKMQICKYLEDFCVVCCMTIVRQQHLFFKLERRMPTNAV